MFTYLKEREYRKAFIWSWAMLFASLFINFYAGTYATEKASNPVTDIILSNIPVFDVDAIFIWGAFGVVAVIAWACLIHPRRIPFALKTIGLFVIVRSVFITLTHIAPFPTHAAFDPISFASYFMFGGDLFFSGHTGLPFLIALMFWDHKPLRILFLILSVVFGSLALMGHLHYSIDVFAAFFITYGIYGIAEQIFKKDKLMGIKT
jgi:hypothetical protein